MNDYRRAPDDLNMRTAPFGRIRVEENGGPLTAGDFKITGGLSLWISHISLQWDRDYHMGWNLRITIRVRVPDRLDPSRMVDVKISLIHGLTLKDDGEIAYGLRAGETRNNWVANRIYDTIRELVLHEVAESFVHDGKFLVDAHADEQISTYP